MRTRQCFHLPPYRRQGLARQIVNAATAHINDSSTDVAILFCVPDKVPFYTASGWTALHGAKTVVGSVGAQRESEPARLMLFVSAKGATARDLFADKPLHITETW